MDYTKDHRNRVNSLLMEKWGYGKKDEAKEAAIDEVIQEGELDEGFLDRIKHAVTSTDNPGGHMPWSDAESREMEEEGQPLHPAIVRMYKRDKPGFRGDKRGWTGKYPPGFWDEDDGAARYAAYQQAAKGDVDEPMLDEMQGHPGKCCDMAHPDEEHEDYMARITIRLAEELPAEEEAPAADPAPDAGAESERDIQKIIAFLPKVNNKVKYEQLVVAVLNHAENVMGSKTILTKLYKSMPGIVKTKGK